jgi:hypothetical protein
VAYRLGQFERAASLCDESLILARELGNREGIANALLTLARLAQQRGDLRRASTTCSESLLTRSDLGDRRGIAECLERTADIWTAQGKEEAGGWLLGAAQSLRESIGAPLSPAERRDEDRVVAQLARRLGVGAAAAVEHGRQMGAADAIDLVLGKRT